MTISETSNLTGSNSFTRYIFDKHLKKFWGIFTKRITPLNGVWKINPAIKIKILDWERMPACLHRSRLCENETYLIYPKLSSNPCACVRSLLRPERTVGKQGCPRSQPKVDFLLWLLFFKHHLGAFKQANRQVLRYFQNDHCYICWTAKFKRFVHFSAPYNCQMLSFFF